MSAESALLERTVAARIAGVAVLVVPSVLMRLSGTHPAPVAGMILFGAGVLGSAILLMWAAETARRDMSGALALALLALIAVLPEYAVDLYYAYAAGSKPEYTAYAAANMTGANRLLVGVGWALVVLAFTLGTRRLVASRGHARNGDEAAGEVRRDVRLRRHHRIELGFLAVAAVIAFIPALTGEIGWYVAVILIALYVLYVLRIAKGGGEGEEQPVGIAARLSELPQQTRRLTTAGLFLLGAVVIFACAEPFADSLVDAGSSLGIDRFLLVQWLAPLASEAPELIVAVVFAWRLRDGDAIGALLSSKVNQWTLLVGTLPFAYRLGGGEWSLPLDSRQTEEMLLTAAQTVLGLAILVDLVFQRREAALLFGLFVIQFLLPWQGARLFLSLVYLALGFTVLMMKRDDLAAAMRAVVRPTPRQPDD
ncbi:sodium:proton exchanger [Actinomadura rupiterrae]|uniref:sodium:proton exchanger n=1 Tax=Actinomadura rupiterrae TaxID=559627 RepID=UPI0020A45917|nr:sodium:proton exchanger [Actinomadura rupiterrae]MCP2337678.1 cation:H+ antiporter [Actinomadura rupiterrae]